MKLSEKSILIAKIGTLIDRIPYDKENKHSFRRDKEKRIESLCDKYKLDQDGIKKILLIKN